ncbi:SDA1-like protein [Spatholobus suberectus]|nr:SDA1-like protein [Spatholobus suberectus]
MVTVILSVCNDSEKRDYYAWDMIRASSNHLLLAADSTMEALHASVKLSLPSLQSKMKCDPEGYEWMLLILYRQFNSLVEIFKENPGISFASIIGVDADPSFAKDLGDRAMFLAHVTPFYANHLAGFPVKLIHLLRSKAPKLPSKLRCDLTRALVLLVNQKACVSLHLIVVNMRETLSLFMELQTLGDKTLKKLAFDHVIHSIRRMNQEHKNHAKNRAFQNVLFGMLQQSDEKLAKRALVTLCELHRRKVWFDERTANAICSASFHSTSRIMIAALSFLLDYEKIENNDDSDGSGSDDELTESPQVILSNATVYKANHQGTTASKKKKKAKLQRVIRSMKKQQRLSSERGNNCYYSPLNHLKDAQGFAEKLFSCLENSNERFEVRMMMLKLIARTVGLHQLILLQFYPFLQKYIQPHQRDITNLLATVVQSCHDMVPPNAVEPLFKQIVNQFVHDRSRPEVITIGLNAVREICMRMPLLMNEDLLQDLALYKKSREKAVSVAARSLIALFREVCPSLLVKKDRGRPIDPKARPKAYGEVNVATAVPGAELLQIIDNDDELESGDSENDQQNDQMSIDSDDDENRLCIDDTGGVDDDTEDNDVISEDEDEKGFNYETGDSDSADDVEDMEDDLEDSEEANEEDDEVSSEEDNDLHISSDDGSVETRRALKKTAMKRKFAEFNGQLIAADSSLRALKKLAATTMGHDLAESKSGILSNEDFQRIKELKAKREARNALAQHGLAKPAAIKVPSSDQLRLKRVDGTLLELHVRKKLSKDERLALVRAGREDRGKYHARTAVKQKKMGGLSNRQKEHKKKMPLAAKRYKIARHQMDKKKKHRRSGKQFRGRKAWK